MALSRSEKEDIIVAVAEQAQDAVGMLVAEYSGMTVQQMTALRNQASETNVAVKVVKNSLARRALEKTQHACLIDALTGPLVLAFAKDGPGDAAKVFINMAKEASVLKVTGLSLGGDLIAGDQVKAVASLPTREEALAKLLGTMQAPATKLTQTLHSVPSKLVRIVDAVKAAKEAA